jgi:signal transduction histidine kinase
VEARLNSIYGRVVLTVFIVNLFTLPLLYALLTQAVYNSASEVFVNHVRSYSRFLADIIERDHLSDEEGIMELLDIAVLSSHGKFAQLDYDEQSLRSSLLGDSETVGYKEDFSFGENGDGTYFLAVLTTFGSKQATLKLGFDESQTQSQIGNLKLQVAALLLAFFTIVMIMAVLFARLLCKPLVVLQGMSNAVAKGDYNVHLTTDSRFREVISLTEDLEHMRAELVGINESLTCEMHKRQIAQDKALKTQKKLHHAQKLQSIGTLTSGVAHEFNNLLQPIMMHAEEILEEMEEDDGLRDDVRRILDSSERARELVSKILAFSREPDEDSGQPVSLQEIVVDVLGWMRSAIPSGVTIKTQLHKQCPAVKGSAEELRQIVVILVTNAYLAIGDKDGTINVAVSSASQQEHAVQLRVYDNGCGIEPTLIDRVFEPFFSTRAVGQGTGLGLYIARGIVMRHGGDISISSVAGRDTIVDVRLPLHATEIAKT